MAPSLPRLPGKVQLVFCRPDLNTIGSSQRLAASRFLCVSVTCGWQKSNSLGFI